MRVKKQTSKKEIGEPKKLILARGDQGVRLISRVPRVHKQWAAEKVGLLVVLKVWVFLCLCELQSGSV